MICQTMKVMNSYELTILLDGKTGVTGFEPELNKESLVHAQASGSKPCGYVKEPEVLTTVSFECVLANKSTTCAHLFHVVWMLSQILHRNQTILPGTKKHYERFW